MKFFKKISFLNLINLFLTLFLIYRLIFLFWQNRTFLLQKYNPGYYQKKFNESQYRNPRSKKLIGDYDLYAYAGWEYIHGANPLTINPEHPPLGKLLIGLVTVLTGFHRISNFIFIILDIICLYWLSHLLNFQRLKSLLLLIALTFDNILIDFYTMTPMLDVIQLFFILLFFIFLKYHEKTKKECYLGLTSLMIILSSSVKFWVNGLFLIICYSFYLLWQLLKKSLSLKQIIKALSLFLIISPLYLVFYFGSILSGISIRTIIGAQKWMYLFHKIGVARFANKFRGNFLEFIFLNRWKIWWSGFRYQAYDRYYFLWPIIFIIFFLLSVFYVLRVLRFKKLSYLSIIILFCLLNIIFISMSPFFPHYMLIFLPFIYLIVFSIDQILKIDLK